ncbi:hypothetical protein B0H13DRAFT_2325579 [Mycena leptocephala]|nr:hypothetical protein B0H13DRAFT_2325579 [Mycena leptocephala]
MEEDAATTIGATSSPPDPRFRDTDLPLNVPFLDLTEADFGESDEGAESGAASRAPKLSNTDKTRMVLESMKKLSRFSLRMFLEELFTSEDSAIKNVTNTYLAQEGHIHLLNLVYTDRVLENVSIAGWIMSKATDLCVKEASRLTDTARKGKFNEEAKSLRLPSHSVKIELLRSFSILNLLKLYDSATPHLQGLLKAIIGEKTARVLAGRAGGSAVRVEGGRDVERILIPLGNGQVCEGEMEGLLAATTKVLQDDQNHILCVVDSQAVLRLHEAAFGTIPGYTLRPADPQRTPSSPPRHP